jgi:hypothetical protein
MQRRGRANLIAGAVLALVLGAGLLAYQYTRQGQASPPAPAGAPAAEQRR